MDQNPIAVSRVDLAHAVIFSLRLEAIDQRDKRVGHARDVWHAQTEGYLTALSALENAGLDGLRQASQTAFEAAYPSGTELSRRTYGAIRTAFVAVAPIFGVGPTADVIPPRPSATSVDTDDLREALEDSGVSLADAKATIAVLAGLDDAHVASLLERARTGDGSGDDIL